VSVEEIRKAAIAKLGENMTIRRFVRYETTGTIATYLHGAKIGVIVDLKGDEALGRDIAMHIAASKPICVPRIRFRPKPWNRNARSTPLRLPNPASRPISSPRW
jgi:translation elongation factor EF-Ts